MLAGAVTGCNNDSITSINNNPNAPTSAPAPAVFTNAVQSAVGNWLGAGYDLRDISLLIQHFAENQYIGNDQYKGVGPGAQNTLFRNVFQNDLEDFQVVVRAGTAAKDASLYAPALILQQWEFGYLTDSWGDVPYSQALAGDSSTAVLNPAYDPQQQIYAGMFAKLTAAATALAATTSSSLGAADPIYQGSNSSWQKFANSLHARDALRIVNVDRATADKELKAAFTAPGGVFQSNADNAQLAWPGDGVFNNPWATNFSSRDDDRMSKTLVDTLNSYRDPRVAIYAMPAAATGLYAGQPNGLTNATAVAYSDTASRPGAIFYPGPVAYGSGSYGGNGNKQPSYLMTYAEVAFIQAEAAELGLGGLNPSQAAAFYNAGITASMNQWGITDGAVISAYLVRPQVVYQGGTAGLNQIAVQRWIALYSDGGQAWFEWRRTCTPSLVPGPAAIYSAVPRRLEYPTIEKSTNNAQVQVAVTRMGGDAPDTRVWWDTKTCP
jgi:Starch-binding associating with outer membrane